MFFYPFSGPARFVANKFLVACEKRVIFGVFWPKRTFFGVLGVTHMATQKATERHEETPEGA
jgi:hypothetical protein